MNNTTRNRGTARSTTSSSRGQLGTQQDVVLPRIGAFVLDYFLAAIVAVVVGFALGIVVSSGIVFMVGATVGYFGYYVFLEGKYGQTVGKRAAGIVVVDRTGDAISYEQAAVRNVLRIVDGLFNYLVGLVVMLTNDDKQRLGDKVGNTLVVRSR